MVLGWYVIYHDESVCSSDDYTPETLPTDGVQWIVECMEVGRRFVHGMDYYAWTGDSWKGGNVADLEKWLRVRPIEKQIVLFGLWVSDEQYSTIREIAKECCK